MGIELTSSAHDILWATAVLGNYKTADGHVLSQSGILFGAITLAQERSKLRGSGYEIEAIEAIARIFLRDPITLAKVQQDDFYQAAPAALDEREPIENATLSYSMRSRLESFKDKTGLDAVDLISSALARPSTFTKRRLDRLGINAGELREQILSLKKSS